MNNIILPVFGIILEYSAIFFCLIYRYDLSSWGFSFPGGDAIIMVGCYITSIMIVLLLCNLDPLLKWGNQ